MIQGRDGGRNGGRITAPRDASWMVESEGEAPGSVRVKANGVSDAACSELEDKNMEDAPRPVQPSRRQSTRDSMTSNAKGLRALSLSLANKLLARGKVNCSDLADELALELSDEGPPIRSVLSEGQRAMEMPGYDRNVRRRVYDALNVLVAVGAIVKDGKFIEWRGVDFARRTPSRRECAATKARIQTKRAQLRELRSQHGAFRRLGSRNKALLTGERPPRLDSKVHCPFAVVKSSPNTDISLDMHDDQSVMRFGFSNKFELLTDAEIVGMVANLPCRQRRAASSSQRTASDKDRPEEVPYPFVARETSPLDLGSESPLTGGGVDDLLRSDA